MEVCWASNHVVNVVYYRKLPFYNEMITRLEKYNETSDWEWKVHPHDLAYLNHNDPILDVEVYVLNPETAETYSKNLGETEPQTIFHVYQARDEHVQNLSQFQHTHFYKSKFTPAICMKVEKDLLPRIANLPFVYCIRVTPTSKLLVTIDKARTYNDLKHVQTYYDEDVDPMDIAIIDTGYEYPEEEWVYKPRLSGEAKDNIEYTWDFVNDDADVTDGANHHGTDCLDLLASGFGDVGDDDSMYDDPDIYSVLKVCHMWYEQMPEPPWWEKHQTWGGRREAIEWCISNDMEVVSMSWELDTVKKECDGRWCDLFRLGVLDGVTWVAGAGNEGKHSAVGYPAASHYVIAVGGYESVDEMTGEAERWFDEATGAGSNYGETVYSEWVDKGPPWGLILVVYCDTCSWPAYPVCSEFKPNVYDAAVISGVGVGTSLATPLAAASIALGIYSQPAEPTDPNWIPGFQMVHDTIALCNEWTVVPAECSQQGQVIDTHTLWHREAIEDETSLTVLAQDQYGNPLATGDVYIEGQLVGYTGSTYVVLKGTHEVFVNDFWEAGKTGYRYGFKNWKDSSTANPRTIPVVEDRTITATFKKKYCPGDVDGDGWVYLSDKRIVNRVYDSYRDIGDPWPSGTNWDSRADLDCDKHVYIGDLRIVSKYYDTKYPDP